MASTQIVADTMQVLMFVRRFMPMPAVENMKGLGLIRSGEMVAGVLLENFNGTSAWMHVAAAPGKRWLTREFLRYCFHYPFIELGLQWIFGWVESDNAEARRFDEHLGFKVHALIPGAGMDGRDVVIYKMSREDCRYV